jgi:thioesterase domain-containing protein
MTARLSAWVELKAGNRQPPVFMVAGGGGSVGDIAELAKYIETGHSLYGIRATSTGGNSKPFERIEDIAQTHLNAITEMQPHGPYILMGYSMGGLIALEMAQRLGQNGDAIALLVMIDTYPHRRLLTIGQRVSLFMQLVKYHASTAMRLPMGKAMPYLIKRAKGRLNTAPQGHHASDEPLRQSMSDSDKLAWSRYQPRVYTGRVRYVRAGQSTYFPKNAAAVWRRSMNHLEVETVPGHHLGIIRQPEKLAAVLSRYLKEASAQDEA